MAVIRSRFIIYWLPFLTYAALILALSSQSHLPGQEKVPDKVAHFCEYGFFALLFSRALTSGVLFSISGRQLLGVIAAGGIYAATDEFYQSFIPHRTSSIYDWLADMAGICGMITFLVVLRKRDKEAHETKTV
jgi:VanZ family protein